MANYFIIGGDKKEYGPISSEDVRQWIAEGRLNAVSEARAENDPEWGLLGAIPEFAEILGKSPPNISPRKPEASGPPSMDFLERDYEVDIGGCVSRGWDLVKNNLGILLLSFLIVFAITIAASGILNMIFTLLIPKSLEAVEAVHVIHGFLLSGLLALVAGPCTGGLYHVFLQTSRKLPVEIGDVFLGFKKYFWPLSVGYLIMAWIGALCLLPFSIADDARLMPILAKMQNQTSPEDLQNTLAQILPAVSGCLPLLLICMLPLIYFTVSLQFTLPLIVDKQMGVMAAVKAGFKMVHMHWWQLCALTIVLDLVNLAGALACCIGMLITVPISTAALMAAYEIIFGASRKN